MDFNNNGEFDAFDMMIMDDILNDNKNTSFDDDEDEEKDEYDEYDYDETDDYQED